MMVDIYLLYVCALSAAWHAVSGQDFNAPVSASAVIEPTADPSLPVIQSSTGSPQPTSQFPSIYPSISYSPSGPPSQRPSTSQAPSLEPSVSSAPSLSLYPSISPSLLPSVAPTISVAPSDMPSISNSPTSSIVPSDMPSFVPSNIPSQNPTASLQPSHVPTLAPTGRPSAYPSDYPSSVPTMQPSYTPNQEMRDCGMYITGLVDTFNRGSSQSRQFETLVDDHFQHYWNTVQRSSVVVYNSTTQFVAILRPPRGWTASQFLSPFGSSRVSTRQSENGTTFDFFDSGGNETLNGSTTFFSNSHGNYTDNNITDVFSNDTEIGYNSTTTPTLSSFPSFSPSNVPTSFPSASQLPSAFPSESVAPSSAPTSVPQARTFVLWYKQTISYGEIFGENDTRTNTVDEVFQFPFLLDQKAFTDQLINITNNQLAMIVAEVEVRDGSVAPSIAPSDMPSEAPSDPQSPAPTFQPTNPPRSSGVSTTTVIVAVVVPVLLVLIIAFAGILYVTKTDDDEEVPGDSVVPLPVQDPGTPSPASFSPPIPVIVNQRAEGAVRGTNDLGASLPQQVLMGTPAASPLIDPSEPFQAQQSLNQLQYPLTDHHTTVSGPPPRTPSHGTTVSEISSIDPGDRARPGYSARTGSYSPALGSLPHSLHSRESSVGSQSTLSRKGLSRAVTTGGMSSARRSPSPAAGRMSPYGTAPRGAIPTIPTSHLSPEVTTGRDDGPSFSQQQLRLQQLQHQQEGETDQTSGRADESGSDSEDGDIIPSMTAFNLQIQDLDDL